MGRGLSDLTYGELVDLRQRAIKSRRVMAFGEISEHLGIDPSTYRESSEERDLWDRYIAEKMWFADQSSVTAFSIPILDVPAEASGKVRYWIRSYSDAQQIVDSFSRNETYLKSLVARVTGNPTYSNALDYRALLHEGYKIRGIAKKILKR